MDFDHENVRPMMNEDRLSSLPDELIHRILSSMESKHVVQTCLLSSRWKFLWTSMPYLNFSSDYFANLPKFSKFVTHFLANRNPQTEVTSLKLTFHGAASQFFVRRIADYVMAHNIQELDVVINPKRHHEFPPRFFSSRSLKSFYFRSIFPLPYLIPKTPWDFPALTSLSLQHVTFREDKTDKYLDLFSKCVNLKYLKLHLFSADDVEVFDIITPQLTNLIITCSDFQVLNLIAPQLEDLTVINCSMDKLNAPPGLSCLRFSGGYPLQLSEVGFHSLEKVTIHLSMYRARKPYVKEVARQTIDMLQEVHSTRHLSLNLDVVEIFKCIFNIFISLIFVQCISAFPGLILFLPSPFIDLICVNIDICMRKDAYKAKISDEAKNFLLGNSPSATFIMDLPEAPPPKPKKPREGWGKKKARLFAEIANHATEFQAYLEMVRSHSGTKDRVKTVFRNLMEELRQANESVDTEMQVYQEPRARIKACLEEMWAMVNQEKDEVLELFAKKRLVRSMLDKLPKQQRAEIEPLYSGKLAESGPEMDQLFREHLSAARTADGYEKYLDYEITKYPDVSVSNVPPAASQPSSSSSLATDSTFVRDL
ncbi:hypothetical protein OSB04_022405 [Centaurea solstitialis]|uniref:F-box domain-containing protein n=1 Tax=Centaurea solstitialis TaxID=347529 RepID=A0AA38W5X4_9ASTR|nr:hypothetical protein OSB04_022405 [Centaurea solstitialis]